jgi:CRISPR-associated protein Csm4
MIVRLTPLGRFLGGLPRSDTLFGALCWGIRWTHGEPTLLGLLEACDRGEPPFVLSSAFPFAEGEHGPVYYLPRPLHWPTAPPGRDLESLSRAKRIRRVLYASRSVFSQVTAGRPPALDSLAEPKGPCLAASGEAMPAVQDVDVDRNAINRVTGAVQEGRLFFGQETGVTRGGAYFLIRMRDEAARPLVEAALRFMEDRGIGGDASVGRGQVRVAVEEGDLLPEDPTAPRYVTLSLLHPSVADRDHLAVGAGNSAYRLVKRKGRVESLYAPTEQPWKTTLVMLAEGSVFPRDGNRAVYGSAPVVKEVPFRVRHNGFGYTVGCADVA